MAQNTLDKSGNAFKYSLIPLMIGVALIFFLSRSCKDAIHEENPKPLAKEFVLTPEEKAKKEAEELAAKAAEKPANSTATSTAPATPDVAQDTLKK